MGPCSREYGERQGLPWAAFEFSPRFQGFAGHFPGRPVLPGVCMLGAAVATLEKWRGAPLRVKGVKRARFLSLVLPGEVLEIECVRHEESPDGFMAAMKFRGPADRKPSECILHYTVQGTPAA